MDRATIRQKKTGRPVRFELTDQARRTIDEYLKLTGRKSGQFLFAGRGDSARGLTTRQYARLVQDWVASIGLDPAKFGTHSLRRYAESGIMPGDWSPCSGKFPDINAQQSLAGPVARHLSGLSTRGAHERKVAGHRVGLPW
jgi:integrase